MIVNETRFPALYKAMLDIRLDTGAGHVGTTYPSGWDAAGAPIYEPIDLTEFDVPEAWESMIAPSESALAALLAISPEDFETFCCGDESDMDAICERSHDLKLAHKLLNDFFGGFSEEDEPKESRHEI